MTAKDEITDFEKFVEEYDGDKLLPKTTYVEDYAGGTDEYVQVGIVEAFLKSNDNQFAKEQLGLIRGKLYSNHKHGGEVIEVGKVIELINEQIENL